MRRGGKKRETGPRHWGNKSARHPAIPMTTMKLWACTSGNIPANTPAAIMRRRTAEAGDAISSAFSTSAFSASTLGWTATAVASLECRALVALLEARFGMEAEVITEAASQFFISGFFPVL